MSIFLAKAKLSALRSALCVTLWRLGHFVTRKLAKTNLTLGGQADGEQRRENKSLEASQRLWGNIILTGGGCVPPCDLMPRHGHGLTDTWVACTVQGPEGLENSPLGEQSLESTGVFATWGTARRFPVETMDWERPNCSSSHRVLPVFASPYI